ncbi:unnamed protein product [Pleuronectes platessa]|uniref:Uncharacterized protein n=1 Tax=Pleuronectes platessa TaxID=8262 RepID=A0A9N7YVT5_PLEPL|nr:unnamed protein product [Pleuronectes platessa]
MERWWQEKKNWVFVSCLCFNEEVQKVEPGARPDVCRSENGAESRIGLGLNTKPKVSLSKWTASSVRRGPSSGLHAPGWRATCKRGINRVVSSREYSPRFVETASDGIQTLVKPSLRERHRRRETRSREVLRRAISKTPGESRDATFYCTSTRTPERGRNQRGESDIEQRWMVVGGGNEERGERVKCSPDSGSAPRPPSHTLALESKRALSPPPGSGRASVLEEVMKSLLNEF